MRSNRTVEIVAIAAGVCAVVFPLLFAAFIVEHSGELGLLVVVFGAYATAAQIIVWAALVWVMQARDSTSIAVAFGAGSWLSLLLSWLFFVQWQNVLAAIGFYAAIAAASASTMQLFFATHHRR